MHGMAKSTKKMKQIDHLQQKHNKFITSDEKNVISQIYKARKNVKNKTDKVRKNVKIRVE